MMRLNRSWARVGTDRPSPLAQLTWFVISAVAAVRLVDRMLSFHQDRGTLMSERLLTVLGPA